MRKILLFLFLAVSTGIFAQLPRILLTPTERVSTFDEYIGSMYSKSRYKTSSIVDEKTGAYDAKLKYNIFTDALEYSQGSKLYQIQKKPTIHARIDGDYFYYCNFKNQRGLERDGYYVLVELNDNYRIYKKLTLDIKDPFENPVSHASEPGKIRISTIYYLEEDETIMELPVTKKEMLATFKDKEIELKKYLKKEGIRLKKEEDLIRLVAKYNALKSSNSGLSRSLLTSSKNRRD